MPEQLPEYLLICSACQSSLRTSDPEKIAKHEADHADCGLMDTWEDFLGGGQ